MSTTGKLSGVQYLRGLAAVAVVIFHSNYIMGHAEYYRQTPFTLETLGIFGVTVFFVISGFIIAIVALDHSWKPCISTESFLLRRFIRIVPLMWLTSIGYNIFTYMGTHQIEWGPALRGLVLWPVGDLKPNVLWTLRHEVLFYLIFSLTILGKKPRPWILVAWFCTPLLVTLLMDLGVYRPESYSTTFNQLIDTLFVGRGASLQFGLGLLMGLLWLKAKPVVKPRIPFAPLAAVVAFAVAAAAIEYLQAALGSRFILIALWSLLSAVVVWVGITLATRKGPGDSVLGLLGDASYSIYLVHNPFILTMLEVSRRTGGFVSPMIDLLIICVVAILGGIATHKLVELPMTRTLSRFVTEKLAAGKAMESSKKDIHRKAAELSEPTAEKTNGIGTVSKETTLPGH